MAFRVCALVALNRSLGIQYRNYWMAFRVCALVALMWELLGSCYGFSYILIAVGAQSGKIGAQSGKTGIIFGQKGQSRETSAVTM